MAGTLNAKLMAAMQAMGNPVRDTKGHNYKYAQLDQVMDVIKPALAANGLAVRQGAKLEGSFLLLETVVFDGDEERVMDVRPIEHMADPQKQGSYETYMRRYALLTVFGLAPEDDDGQAAKPSQKPREAARRAQGGKPAPTPQEAAKARLWAAMQAYGKRNGIDPNDELDELGGPQVLAEKDAAWLNDRAEYYEAN